MRLVVVETPYAGDTQLNLAYVRAAMADCLGRDEAPFASHALYTQPGVLRDEVELERQKGMSAGQAWYAKADACVVYTDLGVSKGMVAGIERARELGLSVELRTMPEWVKDHLPRT